MYKFDKMSEVYQHARFEVLWGLLARGVRFDEAVSWHTVLLVRRAFQTFEQKPNWLTKPRPSLFAAMSIIFLPSMKRTPINGRRVSLPPLVPGWQRSSLAKL